MNYIRMSNFISVRVLWVLKGFRRSFLVFLCNSFRNCKKKFCRQMYDNVSLRVSSQKSMGKHIHQNHFLWRKQEYLCTFDYLKNVREIEELINMLEELNPV